MDRKAMVAPVTTGCLSNTPSASDAATCACSFALNLLAFQRCCASGCKFSSTRSASVNTAPMLGTLLKRSSMTAILSGYQTSSWSQRKMISPLQARIADSKLRVDPRRSLFLWNRTGKGAFCAKPSTISAVASVEASSEIINSSGSRVWRAILSSCSRI